MRLWNEFAYCRGFPRGFPFFREDPRAPFDAVLAVVFRPFLRALLREDGRVPLDAVMMT